MSGTYDYMKVAHVQMDASSEFIINTNYSLYLNSNSILADTVISDDFIWNNANVPDPSNDTDYIPPNIICTYADIGGSTTTSNMNVQNNLLADQINMNNSYPFSTSEILSTNITTTNLDGSLNFVNTGSLTVQSFSGLNNLDISGNLTVTQSMSCVNIDLSHNLIVDNSIIMNNSYPFSTSEILSGSVDTDYLDASSCLYTGSLTVPSFSGLNNLDISGNLTVTQSMYCVNIDLSHNLIVDNSIIMNNSYPFSTSEILSGSVDTDYLDASSCLYTGSLTVPSFSGLNNLDISGNLTVTLDAFFFQNTSVESILFNSLSANPDVNIDVSANVNIPIGGLLVDNNVSLESLNIKESLTVNNNLVVIDSSCNNKYIGNQIFIDASGNITFLYDSSNYILTVANLHQLWLDVNP